MLRDKTVSVFGQSEWIWPDCHFWDLVNCFALFRKSFSLEKPVKNAQLHITADQSYQLWINGKYVCRGPARGYQKSWPFDSINIAKYLQQGSNLIAVRAYNPGFSNFQYKCEGFAGLLVALQVGARQIVSDSSWHCMRQPGIRRDAMPSSLQLFPQEHIDLREEPPHWYDSIETVLGPWQAPATRLWNAPPWYQLEPRNIPQLSEKCIRIQHGIGLNFGANALGYNTARSIIGQRLLEDRSHKAERFSSSFTVPVVGKGNFVSYLFDCGKVHVGNLLVTVDGAAGGEIIDTHLAETIDPENLTLDQLAEANSRMAFSDRLICRQGNQKHLFFHTYGFRYVEITVRDNCGPLHLKIALNQTRYPLRISGAFSSSEESLEKIWQACAWTQQSCMLDAYVDTPWREQVQWWGDARVQAWNTFHLSGDSRLLKRGIGQIGEQINRDGLTYGHAPTMAHSCILPDFSLIWILTLWDYYWQTGNLELFRSKSNIIKGVLTYCRKNSDPKSQLLRNDPRYWLFLDWTDIPKQGCPTLYSLWLLMVLEKMALVYGLLGDTALEDECISWGRELRIALTKLINENGYICDGVDETGRMYSSHSIHSQVIALELQLEGLNKAAIIEYTLLPFIRREFVPAVHPSAYWITYVFSFLSKHGYGREVVDYIQCRWQPMADYGSTWENFTPKKADESHSHAWSAHPIFHFMQIIGGVRQIEPAWRKVAYRPTFIGRHGGCVIPTGMGKIISQWRRVADDKVSVSLALPHGIAADIHLPGETLCGIVGENEWLVSLKMTD